MMKSAGQLVRRYSSALFELGLEGSVLPELRNQVQGLLSVLDKSYIDFLSSPRFSEAEKQQTFDVLVEKLGLSTMLTRFLKVLLENGRFSVVRPILSQVLSQADERLGIARVEVVSATSLSAAEIEQFQKAIASTLNKKVELTHSVDASLRAGTVIKLGNTIVDASLRAKLAVLKESLNAGV